MGTFAVPMAFPTVPAWARGWSSLHGVAGGPYGFRWACVPPPLPLWRVWSGSEVARVRERVQDAGDPTQIDERRWALQSDVYTEFIAYESGNYSYKLGFRQRGVNSAREFLFGQDEFC